MNKKTFFVLIKVVLKRSNRGMGHDLVLKNYNPALFLFSKLLILYTPPPVDPL